MTKRYSGNALRRGRVSIPGQIYLVTTTTFNRKPVFRDLHCARAVVRALMHADRHGDAGTLAYVLMPDHLHWLMQLGETRSLSQVVGRVKAGSGRLAAYPLWQSGFHDRALRSEDDVRSAARYLAANPLRAGLVERIGEYPHWDAIWL